MEKKILVVELTKCEARIVYGSISQEDFEILYAEKCPLATEGGSASAKTDETHSLQKLLERFRKKMGISNLSLIPTIAILPSDGLLVREGSSRSYSTDTGGHLCRLDYRNCLHLIEKQGKEMGYFPLCFVPYLFSCGAEDTDRFPLGENADFLTVHADYYLFPETIYDNYRRLFLSLGIKPYLLFFENLAASHYLPTSQKRREFFLLNLSEEASVLSLIKDNRLVANRYLGRGLNDICHAISEKYRLPIQDARFLVRLFGYEGTEQDIPYPIASIPSTLEFRKSIQEEYEKVLVQVRSMIDELDEMRHDPVIVYGTATELIGSESLLMSRIPRLHSMIRTPIVGAESQGMISCLGAMRLAYENYQPPLDEVEKALENDAIREAAFGRNERRS